MHLRKVKRVLKKNNIKEEAAKADCKYLKNIAHDLATPITVISGYAQLLKEEALSQDELYIRAIDNIQIQSRRLQTIIEEYIQAVK